MARRIRSWDEVDSDNIWLMCFEHRIGKPSELFVVFRADPRWVYSYQGVPHRTFLDVLYGMSPGAVFNETIRSHPELYPYTRERV